MILVVLIVGVLVFGAVMVFVIFGGVIKLEKDQAKAEIDASAILDAAFDGRSDVTFAINMRSLKYETVVLGAKQRGYNLTSQADNQYGPHTLVFEKAAA